MSKIRVAVVGAGHLGRTHARLLHERDDVLLVGIADPLPLACQQVAGECKTRGVTDYHDLLDEVDAAIIATPTHTHHEIALEFLNRGLAVLVEKPLTASVREADELVAAARRRETVLAVGHVERFNPALIAAKPHITEPRFVSGIRAGTFTARSTDIGVVLDLMIHDIDILLHVVRSRVRNVQAMGMELLGRHEDVAHARFEFENGCVAHLSASRVSFGPSRREMHVWARPAFVDIDFAARTTRVVTPSEAVIRHRLDVETMTLEERHHLRDQLYQEHLRVTEPTIQPRNALVDEQQDFLDCVRTGRTPLASGAEGRDALVVAERVLSAIAASAASEQSQTPQSTTPPTILRGPHWPMLNQPLRDQRQVGLI